MYDQEQEEQKCSGKPSKCAVTADQFEKEMEESANTFDLLALLAGDGPVPKGDAAVGRQRSMPSLYPTDLHYFHSGLLREQDKFQFDLYEDRKMVSLTIPKDLERMLKRLTPRGSLPSEGRLNLTTDRKLVQQEIQRARKSPNIWPQIHLLWDLHPAMEWLNYKLLVRFGRAVAPLVTLKGVLGRQEFVFLMQGDIPNRKGQPVVHNWFGVRFKSGRFAGIEDLEALLERTGFHENEFPNPSHQPDVTQAKTLLPEAVAQARIYMSERRAKINRDLEPKLAAAEAKLSALRTAKQRQLEIDFQDGSLAGIRLRQKEERQRRIERIFAEWAGYVRDTLTTEDAAFVRVAAAFQGE